MDFTISKDLIIGGLAIFLLRICDTSMDTLRVLFVVRGKKSIVWVLGVFQSTIFIIAISSALKGDNNLFTILGYATGFATGNVIGMAIEDHLAIGFKRISIVTRDKGEEIAKAIRDAGYGVTEIFGRGRDGVVTMINVNAKRKHVKDIENIALAVDETSFITVDDFSPVNHSGFWRK